MLVTLSRIVALPLNTLKLKTSSVMNQLSSLLSSSLNWNLSKKKPFPIVKTKMNCCTDQKRKK